MAPITEPTSNPYLEGVKAPIGDEITAFDLPVTGHIPVELTGRLLRNGPNPIGTIENPMRHHWFLGDGMVHGVRLCEGKAEWYRNRWVRSNRVAEHLGEEPPTGPTNNGHAGFSPNTNVGGHAGKTFALVEGGPPPTELSYELETIARTDFGGTLEMTFSAHPKLDPASGELHAMTYCWPDRMDHLQYVVLGHDGLVTKTVNIPVPDMPMVHDISLTENWIVVYDLPVTVRGDLLAEGYNFPFGWNPEHPARLGLLPRAAESADQIVWVDVAPCFTFHPVNAYEDPDGNVVIDYCRYERLFDLDVLGPFTRDPAPTLDRWTINPSSRTVNEERIDGRGHEFPRHNPRYGLTDYQFAYTSILDYERPSLVGPIAKTDTKTGQVIEHDFGPGKGGAEPVFVPRDGGASEDDGWVLSIVHDAVNEGAELAIIDAQDFAGPAVATVTLPRRVPFGFHGNWVSDRSVAPEQRAG